MVRIPQSQLTLRVPRQYDSRHGHSAMAIDPVVQKQLEMALAYTQSLSHWALLIFGGTIAILVGTQHASPRSWFRSVYLLFVVAWALLGVSLWHGAQLQSSCVAYYWAAAQHQDSILDAIRSHTRSQLCGLEWALGVLCVWLVIYLVWWIWRLPKEGPSR
jgi:hypothetical protein